MRMEFLTDFKNKWKGVLFCLVVAVPAWFLGTRLEVVGAPVWCPKGRVNRLQAA